MLDHELGEGGDHEDLLLFFRWGGDGIFLAKVGLSLPTAPWSQQVGQGDLG